MVIITLEECAAARVRHMRNLAMALIKSDTLRWKNTPEAERAEVRTMLTRAGIAFPSETELVQHEDRRLIAQAKAAVKQAKAAAKQAQTATPTAEAIEN
jgi:hypothetical protein